MINILKKIYKSISNKIEKNTTTLINLFNKSFEFNKNKLNILNDKIKIIENNQKIILSKLNELLYENNNSNSIIIDNLNENVNQLLLKIDKISINKINNILIERNLIEEKYNIDKKLINNALSFKNFKSLIKILQNEYKLSSGKIKYPFKYKEKSGFDYLYKNKWIHDTYGEMIIEILLKNINNLFMQHNIIDNYLDKPNIMIENQMYILKLKNNDKFKKEFKRNLKIELIKNNLI